VVEVIVVVEDVEGVGDVAGSKVGEPQYVTTVV
jgi:hypothetical protein